MAPHAEADVEDVVNRLPAPTRPPMSANPPRFLIIGAGSRGTTYARAIGTSTNGVCVGIAEPIKSKRENLGSKYIWSADKGPSEGQAFEDWKDFLKYELDRRDRAARGEKVPEGVDGVFICVLDEMHKEVILGLEPLGLHIMCEKPLACTLDDCVSIYRSLLPNGPGTTPSKIFSIGHVLRYSSHNMLLRKLLLEEKVIGEIMSIEHTEPVGWWHFTHSYVRGNWRKESSTAPSLLTKSCHDIDLLLWLLCSPPPSSPHPPHLPSTISSSGSLHYFNKTRKPVQAGTATNCLSCPHEPSCNFSAKKIYLGSSPGMKSLGNGNTKWPVDIVLPEIEDIVREKGVDAGKQALTEKLAEDYGTDGKEEEGEQQRNYFGRCVYEAGNDVCDDQVVTLTWENDPVSQEEGENSNQTLQNRGAKTAVFHMVAFTKKICQRYSHIYGTDGEIYADSESITIEDFRSGETKRYYPHVAVGHGGGDDGLARQFVLAVDRVKNGGMGVEEAQREFVGCSLEEVVRSHAVVFAAEEARRGKVVVDWREWWEREVEGRLAV